MEEIVKLNVGGYLYTTSRSTLTRYPDSMLGAMFSGRFETAKDRDGNHFIDANGALFSHVIGYLRHSELVLPRDFKEHCMLQKEAEFYQIPALTEAVARHRRRERRSTKTEYVIVEFLTVEKQKSPTTPAEPAETNARICGPPDAIQSLGKQLKIASSDVYPDVNGLQEIFIPGMYAHGMGAITQASIVSKIIQMGFRICDKPDYPMINPKPKHQTHMWFIREHEK